MNLDDDQISRLMVNIDPAVTPLGAELTAAQRSLLERLKTGDDHVTLPRSGGRRWWGAGVTSAVIAACAVLALVIVPNLIHSPRAAALTPLPLTYAQPSQTAEQVLAMAKTQLAESTGPETPLRAAEYIGWYLQVDNLPDGTSRVAISPQDTTFTWAEDRSGHHLIVAGEPYWADDATGNVPASEAPPAGEVLSETTYGVGEFDIPSTDAPGTSPDDMLKTLTGVGLPPDADTFALIETTQRLLTLWTLTTEQHATLLQLILQREGVTVLGETTDRLGRDVIGVAATASSGSGLQDTLLISADTGRIVGVETTRVTSSGSLPAGSVVAYTVWKDTPQ